MELLSQCITMATVASDVYQLTIWIHLFWGGFAPKNLFTFGKDSFPFQKHLSQVLSSAKPFFVVSKEMDPIGQDALQHEESSCCGSLWFSVCPWLVRDVRCFGFVVRFSPLQPQFNVPSCDEFGCYNSFEGRNHIFWLLKVLLHFW